MEIKEYQLPLSLMGSGSCTVRIMTPDGYQQTDKRYPVLYMNDGQDAFFDKDILWGDCSMDFAQYYQDYKGYLPEFILVALCCPKDRAERTELYTPFVLKDGERPGVKGIAGKGKAYAEWMVRSLKPWVDANYRTRREADATAILGYSTGGILAVYAAFAYPDVFSRLAALSSSVALWKQNVIDFFQTVDAVHLQRIYMDVGTNEFGRFTTKEEFLQGANLLYTKYMELQIPKEKIKYNIYPEARHSQLFWKQRFPDAIRWIFPR